MGGDSKSCSMFHGYEEREKIIATCNQSMVNSGVPANSQIYLHEFFKLLPTLKISTKIFVKPVQWNYFIYINMNFTDGSF